MAQVSTQDFIGETGAIEDGQAGYIVNSVAIMAEKILLLADDKELRKIMGEAARKRAKEKFLIDECSSRIVTVIENVNHGSAYETF